MTVIGRFENGALLVREEVAGPASYATGAPPTIEFSDLRVLDQVVSVISDDGRSVQRASFTGKILTYRVRGQDVAQIASGTVVPTTGSDTIVTGIGRILTAAIASLKGAISLTHMNSTVSIGDQAGSPAAGSIIITHTKPTGVADVTPVAATTPWSAVDWVAYAADDGATPGEVPDTTDLSGSTYIAIAIGT